MADKQKVSLKDVLKQDQTIEIDENGKVHLPILPTDAAQPVKDYFVKLLEAIVGFPDDLQAATVRDRAWDIALEISKYLHAHPEDAPVGCPRCADPSMAVAEDGRKYCIKCGWPEDALGGPWEISHHYEFGSAVPGQYDVTRHHGKALTWAEAIAERDDLNRLATKGETDGSDD